MPFVKKKKIVSILVKFAYSITTTTCMHTQFNLKQVGFIIMPIIIYLFCTRICRVFTYAFNDEVRQSAIKPESDTKEVSFELGLTQALAVN